MFNNVPVSGKWVGQHSLITSQWCTRAQLLLNIALCIGHQLLFSQTQKSHAFSILQAAVMCLLSGETCFCPYSQHFSYTDYFSGKLSQCCQGSALFHICLVAQFGWDEQLQVSCSTFYFLMIKPAELLQHFALYWHSLTLTAVPDTRNKVSLFYLFHRT